MITVGHKPNEEKEYKIIRDYYSHTQRREGILFVLADKEDNQTFSKFLPQKQINNDYEWEKMRSGDVHFVSAGVESGSESKLIIETGFIKMKSKLLDKEKTYTYRKYRFILKNE